MKIVWILIFLIFFVAVFSVMASINYVVYLPVVIDKYSAEPTSAPTACPEWPGNCSPTATPVLIIIGATATP